MPKAGNWNRNPWNRGKARAAKPAIGLSPVMRALVAERVHQQCTQEMMAERTQWAQSAISAYERGVMKVPLAYVEAAAKVLGKKVRLV